MSRQLHKSKERLSEEDDGTYFEAEHGSLEITEMVMLRFIAIRLGAMLMFRFIYIGCYPFAYPSSSKFK